MGLNFTGFAKLSRNPTTRVASGKTVVQQGASFKGAKSAAGLRPINLNNLGNRPVVRYA